MNTMQPIYIWIAELVPLLAGLIAFLYGLKFFFKKGKPLYLQSITMAMGCISLGHLYQICRMLTMKTVTEGFTPAYLGKIGFFLFLITATYAHMDKIIDDGSKAFRPSRRIALIAPAVALLLYVPNLLVSQASGSPMIVLSVIWLLAAVGMYFNMKHAIIPNLDFGFVRAIKPYNVLAVCLELLQLLILTARSYGAEIPLAICSVLFGVLAVVTMITAKKGADQWRI